MISVAGLWIQIAREDQPHVAKRDERIDEQGDPENAIIAPHDTRENSWRRRLEHARGNVANAFQAERP